MLAGYVLYWALPRGWFAIWFANFIDLMPWAASRDGGLLATRKHTLGGPRRPKMRAAMTRGRILLIGLLVWGLAMIVPDLIRVGQPLASFGFYANNDGLIYDVTGPFPNETFSPAWKAGIRRGNQLDLSRLKCMPNESVACGDALAELGGIQYTLPGRRTTLYLAPTVSQPARQVTLAAEARPSNFLVSFVLILDQIAGIMVVIAAAWLVWMRPSAMSWGFFLYVNWFNPGQSYAYYAILQQWPALLLLQDVLGCIAQAVGYAGLILFVIRVPNDETEPRWRTVERVLPLVALFLALLLMVSYGSVFGFRTEFVTRVGIIAGFPVALCALAILMLRRKTQRPEDYQRLRWVLWGALIGLPAFLIAELASETTVFNTAWGDFTPPEEAVGLLYLVNGILCLFVFEAVRRKRVVNVAIPLRRVSIITLMLSVPVLLLHTEAERIQRSFDLPIWAWLLVGAATVFVISRLQEGAVSIVDRYFNRALDQLERELGGALVNAHETAEVHRLLVDEPFRKMRLTSAASFCRQGSSFLRDGDGNGWDDGMVRTLREDNPLLTPVAQGEPFSLTERAEAGLNLPSGLSRPVLAVPVVNPVRCFAVSMYGPHTSGTDLDANERAMLARLARQAAAMYAELETGELREKVRLLERELQTARSSEATAGARNFGH
jgi:hypothetical protein